MDNLWWTSGVFTLAGGALAHFFNMLNSKREHQFRREEAELERETKRQDIRQNLYARFLAQCRRSLMGESSVDRDRDLSDLAAEIELGSIADEVARSAITICAMIAELPNDVVKDPKERDTYQRAVKDITTFTRSARAELKTTKERCWRPARNGIVME